MASKNSGLTEQIAGLSIETPWTKLVHGAVGALIAAVGLVTPKLLDYPAWFGMVIVAFGVYVAARLWLVTFFKFAASIVPRILSLVNRQPPVTPSQSETVGGSE